MIQPLRVLIVEDTPDRQKILTQLYRDQAWVLVESSHRAIALLNAYDFDLISLDYNIKGDAEGDTVARTLQNSRNRNSRVIIHSMNPKGAERIAAILPQAIQMPVHQMVRSNAYFQRLRVAINEQGVEFDWNLS